MYRNDFGPEYEVCAHTYCTLGKREALAHECAGRMTADTAAKNVIVKNAWIIETSSDPSTAQDTREFVNMTPEVLLAKVKDIILRRGNYGFRGLARSFRIMDDNKNGWLDKEDFKWGLWDYGIQLVDEEFDTLMQAFDHDGDGHISFSEFIVTLRGDINERRRQLINMAYDVLDHNGDGIVTLEDISAIYDLSFHPGVQDGSVSAEDAYREFMTQWDTQEKDGIITRSEFEGI